jgi:tetratricopeptide (TPR) repeat protein/O-antigen ligase
MRQHRKGRPRKKEAPPKRDWAATIGEATILLVIVAVPLIIHRQSTNASDLKDVVLGLGVALGLALVLLESLRRGVLTWVRSPLSAAIGVFALWTAATLIFSQYRWVTISEFGRLAAHLVLYFLVLLSIRRMAQVRRIIGVACITAVPICIYAFFQRAGLDPIPWKEAPTRVFSTQGNATYLASFLILLIPLAVAVAYPRPRPAAERGAKPAGDSRLTSYLLFAAVLLMAVCLYLTVTLAAWIGLILGSAVAILLAAIHGGKEWLRKAALKIVVVAVGLAVLLGIGYHFLPERQQQRVQTVLHFQDPYGQERRLHWRMAYGLFREHPLVGIGYGTYRIHVLERMSREWYSETSERSTTMIMPNYAHNEYLQIMAGTGAIGTAAFFAVLGIFYVLSVRLSLREEDAAWRHLGLGMVAGMSAFFVQNIFGVTFRQTGAVTFFWLWLGLLAVASARHLAPGDAEALPRLREIRFRPFSTPALALTAIAFALALTVLSWFVITPVVGSVYLKRANSASVKGTQFLAQGNSAEAQRAFTLAAGLAEDGLRFSPYSATGCYTAAYAYGQLGDYEKSLTFSLRALELRPGNASAHYNLGVAYKQLDRLDEALVHLRRAAELMPNALANRAGLADTLRAHGDYEEAEQEALAALELDDRNPNVYLMLADIKSEQHDLPAAADYLARGARRAPSNLSIRQQYAELLLALRRYEEAQPVCRVWLQMDPGSARAHNGLGTCQFHLGEYEAAKESFQRAVAIDPSYQIAALNLGNVYGTTGDYAAALRQFQEVVRMDPNTPEGQIAQRQLAQFTRGRRSPASR